LRKAVILQNDPRRYWKKRVLHEGEFITLRPGRLLLGRTYEEFSVPGDCAGKIEGRSSFARLGLNVHCTQDFANPGYRGHMPLQLYDSSPSPIRIFPYIPICQLILIRLSSTPTQLYGIKQLQSKYMNDDGGPSYWWRDDRIKRLQEALRATDISLDIQDRVLQKFVEAVGQEATEGEEVLLNEFLKSETRKRKRERMFRIASPAVFSILGSASIGSLFVQPFTILHYILWLLTAGSAIPFSYVLIGPEKSYLEKRI
jgi:deoxycytidine triphosphate deaminase